MSLVPAIASVAVRPATAHIVPVSPQKECECDRNANANCDGARILAHACDDVLNEIHAASYRGKEARS